MRRSFRYKGVLSVAGKTQKFVFQGVGMLFSGGFVRAEWGADETRENRFVFIGRDLDKQRLLDEDSQHSMQAEERDEETSYIIVFEARGNDHPSSVC